MSGSAAGTSSRVTAPLCQPLQVQSVLSKALGQWNRRQCRQRLESPDAPSVKYVQNIRFQSQDFNWQRAQAPSLITGIDDRDSFEATCGIVRCIRIAGDADIAFKAALRHFAENDLSDGLCLSLTAVLSRPDQ